MKAPGPRTYLDPSYIMKNLITRTTLYSRVQHIKCTILVWVCNMIVCKDHESGQISDRSTKIEELHTKPFYHSPRVRISIAGFRCPLNNSRIGRKLRKSTLNFLWGFFQRGLQRGLKQSTMAKMTHYDNVLGWIIWQKYCTAFLPCDGQHHTLLSQH